MPLGKAMLCNTQKATIFLHTELVFSTTAWSSIESTPESWYYVQPRTPEELQDAHGGREIQLELPAEEGEAEPVFEDGRLALGEPSGRLTP